MSSAQLDPVEKEDGVMEVMWRLDPRNPSFCVKGNAGWSSGEKN
jgi:hypothetical protein